MSEHLGRDGDTTAWIQSRRFRCVGFEWHICQTVPGSGGVAERNVPHWPPADAPR